jgi:hypothetical protein
MEKKTISVHAVTIHVYWVVIAILLLIIGLMGGRYWHLRWSMMNFTKATMWMNQQGKPNGMVSDYGQIVAVSVGQYVPAADLEKYVMTLSKSLNRDIVILDKGKKVLADTVEANKGTTYTYDTNGEIQMTLSDGKTRTFMEKSTDYPSGVEETVVPMKNAAGVITGVVLVSSTEVFH